MSAYAFTPAHIIALAGALAFVLGVGVWVWCATARLATKGVPHDPSIRD